MKYGSLGAVALLYCGSSLAAVEIPPYQSVERPFPLSPTISACSNFFEHVCSEESKKFTLPPTRSAYYYYMTAITDQLEKAQVLYLTTLSREDAAADPVAAKVRQAFSACMADDATHARDESDFKDRILDEVSRFENKESILKVFGEKAATSGIGSFFEIASIANLDNPKINDFAFYPALELNDVSYAENAVLLDAYRDLKILFFQNLGVPDPESAADAVVRFQVALARVFPDPGAWYERFETRNYLTSNQIIEQFPRLRLEQMLAKVPQTTLIRDISSDLLRVVDRYFAEASDSELIALYLDNVLGSVLEKSAVEYDKAATAFAAKFFGGPLQKKVGQDRCIETINSKFSQEMGYLTLSKLFPSAQSQIGPVRDMVRKITAAARKRLETNSWLSSGAKAKAVSKLDRLNNLLGMPSDVPSWGFTPDFSMTNSELQNDLAMSQAIVRSTFEDLSRSNNPTRWFMSPLDVNAYYSPETNTFVLPLAQVIPPNFDGAWPMYRNLGAAGSIVGHEIGHAFDPSGARFDEVGRLAPWMTERDQQEFATRTQKLIDQFDGAGIHGEQTQTENVADFFGLRLAFDAAFDAGGTADEKKSFFYEFAKQWCGVWTPAYRERQLETDIHAPADARVNQTLRQIPEFQETFRCAPSDPMGMDEEGRIDLW